MKSTIFRKVNGKKLKHRQIPMKIHKRKLVLFDEGLVSDT
jgi:hypothetical protein